MRLVFLLSKDIDAEYGGDVTMSRLLMHLVSEEHEVTSICLAKEQQPASGSPEELPGSVRVAKPSVRPWRLLSGSIGSCRSLVHSRFDVPQLRHAIDAVPGDLFIAEHSYMAESFLASATATTTPLLVNTVVSESLVWKSSRGLLGQLQSPLIRRDELRVARAAAAVATYDWEEAEWYRQRQVSNTHWLDVSLPPATQVDLKGTGPELCFVGSGDWEPNREALQILLSCWPAISSGIPGARLHVVGRDLEPGLNQRLKGDALARGVKFYGFVEDLNAVLSRCRALVAPIRTGGGVRVKILDAVSRGLPVIGSTEALGSLALPFALTRADSAEGLIEQSRRMLRDRKAAGAEGDRLYQLNRERWENRVPHHSVRSWLESACVA